MTARRPTDKRVYIIATPSLGRIKNTIQTGTFYYTLRRGVSKNAVKDAELRGYM
jgi:hypothetical protein